MKLLYLRLTNFASHIDSYIDFTKFNSALIIGMNNNNPDSSNGSGKTSIVKSVGWCWYEKLKNQKVEDVIRYNSEETRVEVAFEKNGYTYTTIRKRSRGGAKSFQLKQDGNDISGSTDTDTRLVLEKILGFDYELFVNSVFLEQGELNYFVTTTPGNRKDIIKSILDITKWDIREWEAKGKAKEAKRRLDEYEKKYNKKELLKNVQTISKELKQLKIKKNNLEEEAKKLEKKIGTINFLDVKEKERIVSEFKRELSEIKRGIKDKKKKEEGLKKEKEEIDEFIKENILEQPIEPFLKQVVRDEIEIRNNLEREQDRAITKLEDLIELKGGKCDKCGSNVSKEDKKRINDGIKKEKSQKQKEIGSLDEKIEKLNVKVDELKREYRNYEKKQKDYEYLVREIESKKELLGRVNNSLIDIGGDIEQFVQKAKVFRSKLAETDIDLLDEDLIEAKKTYDEVNKNIDEANINLGIYTEKRNRHIKNYKEYLNDKDIIENLKKDVFLYDQLRKIFGKKGIQSVIMSKVIYELEVRTNEVLKIICSEDKQITVSIDTQREGNDGVLETFDINAVIGSRISNFGSLSTGEQVRVAFAMRIALSQILSSRRSGNIGVILLDEVDSSLDTIGIQCFIRVVKMLEKKFKVLVITHKDDIKDAFEHKILVKNDYGVSRVY